MARDDVHVPEVDETDDLPEVSGFGMNLTFGVDGESTHKDHKGEIEVLSWSLGASQLPTRLGPNGLRR